MIGNQQIKYQNLPNHQLAEHIAEHIDGVRIHPCHCPASAQLRAAPFSSLAPPEPSGTILDLATIRTAAFDTAAQGILILRKLIKFDFINLRNYKHFKKPSFIPQ